MIRIGSIFILLVVVLSCSNPRKGMACPTVEEVAAAFHDTPLPMQDPTNVKPIGEARHGRETTCFYEVETIWGESRRATTRLVVWDGKNGLEGWYALPGVLLIQSGPGFFEYTDSTGETQSIDVSSEPVPQQILIDGEIVHFTQWDHDIAN